VRHFLSNYFDLLLKNILLSKLSQNIVGIRFFLRHHVYWHVNRWCRQAFSSRASILISRHRWINSSSTRNQYVLLCLLFWWWLTLFRRRA